jgi:uncharacterized protein YbaP (TraB family)
VGRAKIGLQLAVLCAALFVLPSGNSRAADSSELLVWKISSDASPDAVVFVYGSAPTPRKEILRLDPAVEEAYAKATVLLLPTNSVDLGDPEKMRLIAENGLLPAGQTLESKLPAESFARLKQAAEAFDLKVLSFQSLRPWFVADALELSQSERLGFFLESEQEYYFLSRARADGKESIVLESLGAAGKRMSALPMAVQVKYLDLALYRVAPNDPTGPALYEAWRSNDAAALEAATLAPLQSHPELAPALEIRFDDSERIATGLEKLLKRGMHAFAVIPVQNLVGERGAPALMRARGYKAERLGKAPAPES